MKIVIKLPKRRSAPARALADPRFRKRVVKSAKVYARKGRNSSTRKFEDSIQLTNGRALIDFSESFELNFKWSSRSYIMNSGLFSGTPMEVCWKKEN